MTGDGDAEPARESVDRPLETGIVERDEVAAGLADEMVMVMLAGRLEAGLSVPHLDALDQVVLGEQLEHSVDAGPARGAAGIVEPLLDLGRAQRAPLVLQ